MLYARRNEEGIARSEGLCFTTTVKIPAAACDNVQLIPLVRPLWIVALRPV